jgi:hypothetical protein
MNITVWKSHDIYWNQAILNQLHIEWTRPKGPEYGVEIFIL